MTADQAATQAKQLANKHKREFLEACEKTGDNVDTLSIFMITYAGEVLDNPVTNHYKLEKR